MSWTGGSPFHLSFSAERNDHLVEQGVAEPRDLCPRTGLGALFVGGVRDPQLAAAGRAPDAQDRFGAHDFARHASIGCESADRHLDRDRVDVEGPQSVHPGFRGRRNQVQVLKRSQVGEVEDRPEIHEEGVVALTREDRLTGWQRVDRFLFERPVGGDRSGADVARWAFQLLAEDLAADVAFAGFLDRSVDAPDGVELAHVPVGIRERLDLSGVVKERVRIGDPRLEGELVRDLRHPIAVVVDVDRVQDVVAELEEVRSAGGKLRRQVVGDDRDRFGFVRAHKRIHVGVIRHRVLADLRCLAMRRHVVLPLCRCPGSASGVE